MKKHKVLFNKLTAIVLAMLLMTTLVMQVFTVFATGGETERRGSQNYVSNQGELVETPLVQLPLGAVKAQGWLENQLLLQKNGVTGNMHTFRDYNSETSGWLGAANGETWERGAYYFRGLVALAYALDDQELIEETELWVTQILASQTSDGYFGPVAGKPDWWPRMPILMGLRDYYETQQMRGVDKSEILDFMEKYFRYQIEKLKTNGLSSWASARGGDNIDSVYWLYNQLGGRDEDAWLLELGTLLYGQTLNWTNEYTNTTVRQHVVNTSQGMKTPSVYYQYKKEDIYADALQTGLFNMGIDHGRIDSIPNSDEAARDNRSTRGSETCGVVEGLLSTEIAMRIFGHAWMGDRIEQLAYNALPATMTPDQSGHTYYILQNQVMATLGNHEFGNDHGDSSAFGAPLGFDCCFSNYHMGWPKFVQTMWMGTANDGLAIVLTVQTL